MNSNLLNKALFVLRILLGLAMIYFWVTKIGAPEMKIAFIGGAGAKMGLDFLSVTTWFWIAVVGEILAGLLLLAGGKLWKIGALLTLIIMVFVGNAIGWNISNVNFVLTTLAALVVLFYGTGSWNDGSDTGNDTDLTKIGGMGGLWAMVGAGAMMESLKDKVGDVANIDSLNALKDKMGDLGDLAASAKGHIDNIADTASDYADQAKDLIAKADAVLPDSVSDKLNEVVDFVSDKADQAKVMVTKVSDKVQDGVEVIS